ncbi:MAG: cell division protein ZapA [Candidatus Alcyoniella australis]|nr:cell division protein ZapA [Candidatus Alcyoniella australis]
MADLIELSILGKRLKVNSEGNDEYVREVAQYVVEKMDEVQKNGSQSASLNVAIMAALNIADDYFKSVGHQKTLFDKIEKKCDELIGFIDSKV